MDKGAPFLRKAPSENVFFSCFSRLRKAKKTRNQYIPSQAYEIGSACLLPAFEVSALTDGIGYFFGFPLPLPEVEKGLESVHSALRLRAFAFGDLGFSLLLFCYFRFSILIASGFAVSILFFFFVCSFFFVFFLSFFFVFVFFCFRLRLVFRFLAFAILGFLF